MVCIRHALFSMVSRSARLPRRQLSQVHAMERRLAAEAPFHHCSPVPRSITYIPPPSTYSSSLNLSLCSQHFLTILTYISILPYNLYPLHQPITIYLSLNLSLVPQPIPAFST